MSSASQNQAILKKFLLKASFTFSYSLCFFPLSFLDCISFLFQRIFSVYPFFFLAYRDIKANLPVFASKSQKAWISVRVTIGMGWPCYICLAWPLTRLEFPWEFRPKSDIFTSVSHLTNYKHICYPRIHFRSPPVVIVWFLHARTDNQESVSAVAEGEVEEMGNKSISRRKVTGRLFKSSIVQVPIFLCRKWIIYYSLCCLLFFLLNCLFAAIYIYIYISCVNYGLIQSTQIWRQIVQEKKTCRSPQNWYSRRRLNVK